MSDTDNTEITFKTLQGDVSFNPFLAISAAPFNLGASITLEGGERLFVVESLDCVIKRIEAATE
jgi:hypothetical protein